MDDQTEIRIRKILHQAIIPMERMGKKQNLAQRVAWLKERYDIVLMGREIQIPCCHHDYVDGHPNPCHISKKLKCKKEPCLICQAKDE